MSNVNRSGKVYQVVLSLAETRKVRAREALGRWTSRARLFRQETRREKKRYGRHVRFTSNSEWPVGPLQFGASGTSIRSKGSGKKLVVGSRLVFNWREYGRSIGDLHPIFGGKALTTRHALLEQHRSRKSYMNP
jgi:hypothetical protein